MRQGEYYITTEESYFCLDIKKGAMVKVLKIDSDNDLGTTVLVKELSTGAQGWTRPSFLDGPWYRCKLCNEYVRKEWYGLCEKCADECGLTEFINQKQEAAK